MKAHGFHRNIGHLTVHMAFSVSGMSGWGMMWGESRFADVFGKKMSSPLPLRIPRTIISTWEAHRDVVVAGTQSGMTAMVSFAWRGAEYVPNREGRDAPLLSPKLEKRAVVRCQASRYNCLA